jgi:transcriptional pleiotropic regulator of transition state genes
VFPSTGFNIAQYLRPNPLSKKRREKEKMKSTGIVRRVDELGRVVIPIELRRAFDIGEKDGIEIYTEGDHIVLKKYTRGCIFCENTRDVTEYKGKDVCASCIEKIKEL